MLQKIRALFKKTSVQNKSETLSVDEITRYLSRAQLLGYGNPKTLSTVYSCVRLLSDAVAQLPLKLLKVDADGNRVYAKSDPLYKVLAYTPCPWMDKYVYWKFNINCLLLKGFFVSHVIRSGNGKVERLVPVNPDNVHRDSIYVRNDGELVFPITGRDGATREYPANQLFFAYYETLDTVRPVSPIEFAYRTTGLAQDAENYGSGMLKKVAVPPGYFSSDQKLSEEAIEAVKSQLKGRTISTADNLLLPFGIKYNTVSLTASDLQMLETRRYQKEEICGIFGVPPHMIGDTTQAKGWSTMEQTMTEFLQLSLSPILTRIENAVVTRLIPRAELGKNYAKFEVGGLLRADTTARANWYKTMNMIGVLSANEIRAKEDLNPIPGGDAYFVQSNMTTQE